jgi:GGDEF domain-containing protein
VRYDPDHDVVTEAALAARYRQRRLTLLVLLLVATVVPIVVLDAWWLWPLLVVPAALAAPLAGGTGLIATLLAAAIALAAASSGEVTSSEVFVGFLAIVVVGALGAAHEGMGGNMLGAWASARSDSRGSGPAPDQVFDIIAQRDCRRAAETGSPVSVAMVAIPRVDSVGREHGDDVLEHLLDTCSAAVAGVVSGADLLTELGDGRYVALVAGPADAAHEVAQRMAMALERVAIRDRDGLRVTAGAVAVGVAEWTSSDTGPDSLIDRAGAELLQDLVRSGAPGASDDQATGQFTTISVADAA